MTAMSTELTKYQTSLQNLKSYLSGKYDRSTSETKYQAWLQYLQGWLSNRLITRNRDLHEKLTNSQSQEIATFHGNVNYVTVFTTVHFSLSWAGSIPSTVSHSILWRSTLTVSSHLHMGLPSCLLLLGFFPPKPWTSLCSSPMRCAFIR